MPSLGGCDSDKQRTDEPGADGGRHGIDTRVVDARLLERARCHVRQCLHVRTARDLGHHATEASVLVELARHDRRQHVGAAQHDRRGSLVATRLDAQHHGGSVNRTTCHASLGIIVSRHESPSRSVWMRARR